MKSVDAFIASSFFHNFVFFCPCLLQTFFFFCFFCFKHLTLMSVLFYNYYIMSFFIIILPCHFLCIITTRSCPFLLYHYTFMFLFLLLLLSLHPYVSFLYITIALSCPFLFHYYTSVCFIV